MRMRILFCGTGWLDAVPIFARAIAAHGVEANVVVRDARPLREQLADVEVVLPSNAPFGAELVGAAPQLRLIQQPAVGHEAIDLAAARARGIPVCNAPGTNAESVAQATLLLVLALARRLPRARKEFARGAIGVPSGIDLFGKTIAIVGYGRTGRAFGRIVEAMGMRVLAVGREGGREALHRALAAADVVTVHAPLTPDTRGLFDDAAFAAMRPGALLVNVARGGLIDRPALERALENGLGGVGLDVFWEEPWDPNDPLFARDDVVVLPHLAGSTDESFARIADVIGHNVRAIVEGTPLLHRLA